MDKPAQYGEMLQDILRESSAGKSSFGDVEVETIFFPDQDHDHAVNVGWNRPRRIHGCLLHADAKESKIGIPPDGTEAVIANQRIAAGVPNRDIVLTSRSPSRGKFTDFAVG